MSTKTWGKVMWGTGSINIVCSEGKDRTGLQRALDDLH